MQFIINKNSLSSSHWTDDYIPISYKKFNKTKSTTFYVSNQKVIPITMTYIKKEITTGSFFNKNNKGFLMERIKRLT